MENKSYKNLITLLKLFKNRPYHLAKFLIENSAMNEKFINNVLNSSQLNEISEKESLKEDSNPNFLSISQMNDFYDSLIDDREFFNKSRKDLEIELNEKLNVLIKQEKFEEAAYIRDLMKEKNIKRKLK
jgi:hypothetical protein